MPLKSNAVSTADLHLSPREAARKLGVTAKALRLYERHGLVKPIRAANGWRTYGPAEMARLHQVLALKGLGLPLKRMSVLLAGRFGTLDAVLELQEELLQRQTDRLGRALSLVQSARKRLASGESLSIDDLSNLTTETTMTNKPTDAEMKAIFEPLAAKHFSPDQLETLAQRPFDPTAVAQEWETLIADAKSLMAKGDTTSPAALDLVRRWQAQLAKFTGGVPEMAKRAGSVWREAMSDPAAAPKLPLTPDIFAFIGQVVKNVPPA